MWPEHQAKPNMAICCLYIVCIIRLIASLLRLQYALQDQYHPGGVANAVVLSLMTMCSFKGAVRRSFRQSLIALLSY